ncbi:MAG: tyrosine-type recombinase/integrase [Planctomycetota bacterium]
MRRRSMSNGAPVWQVRWRENGVQFARTFSKRPEADDFVRQVGVIKNIQSAVAASMVEPGKLVDLIPEYTDFVRAKNKHASIHADQVRDCLFRSIKRMDVTWTNEINARAINRLVSIHGDHKSTLKKAISIIKTFLRWVRQSHLLIDEEILGYKAAKYIPKERQSWTEDEVRRLLAECDKPNAADTLPSGDGTGRGSPEIVSRMVATRDYRTRQAVRPALWLMLRYGPRPIETAKLSVGDWNPRSRTLTLPSRITKNGHARSFVVDPETADQLTAAAGRRPPSDPLFCTYKGEGHPWTSHHLTDRVGVLIKRAKLPGTPYCCRHTACSRLIVLAQGDLPLVQSITGHRSLAELSRYSHATVERRNIIADAYAKT